MKRFIVCMVALANSAIIPAVSAGISRNGWQDVTHGFRLQNYPAEFQRAPPASPSYMVDNTDNVRGVAPSKGKYNGPVWPDSGSFEGYMKKLAEKRASTGNTLTNTDDNNTFWLSVLGPHGKAPLAEDNYVFYRNVLDYGADNTGASNTEEAINAAIMDGNRCGEDCGSTTARPALIYFPPGTYKICTPIIQYYFTQFVGDPNDRPIIKGCDTFTGMALMDVNPYIPGSGINWYIPQNQFFRQIRNFVFDLKSMPAATDENGQPLVPTGIHWQVSQACTLQNLLFQMPTYDDLGKPPTHVGIFTENGSGGFVSDLVFQGGAIGWRVGSQQYTATSLQFSNCTTAVNMVWDWGFNWHKIEIDGGSIAFNISGIGGLSDQGVGSVSIIDSTVKNVPIGILAAPLAANVVLDNTAFTNVGTIMVLSGTNDPIIEGTNGTKDFALWDYGKHYINNQGASSMGESIDDHPRPSPLLDDTGKLFTRLRPQYESLPVSSFLVATDEGCFNNGTGDNTDAINAFLKKALDAKQVAYFPAGIYSVQGTVTFPTGSQIQGSGWSQIQATGTYFSNMTDPKVVVRVGEVGDVGTMEIADMLFTTKGATAGAIMMEWNLHESTQGAAALWDSHIRIGGANGTDLDSTACPKSSQNEACIGASLLLHVTKDASGYFENFWAWVADHNIDMSLPREMNSTKSQISVFGARGILIESQGPVWLYGSGSEHLMFYQYQLLGAKNVYLGHLQTESPYFQPQPIAPSPMDKALGVFSEDPNWADCKTDTCKMAWGLRILNSESVMVHGAGMYSFFNSFSPTCTNSDNCQDHIMEVRGSKDISIYNIFTKGVVEIATGSGNESSIELADGNQHGFTSEISVWFPLDSQESTGDSQPQDGGSGPQDGANIVYVGPEVYQNHTVQCPSPPCILVMPPTTLATPTTIYIDPYTTEVEVGQSQNGTFSATTTTLTITVASIVTSVIPVANYNYTGEESEGAPLWITPSIDLPPTPIVLTKPDGVVTTRTLTLPPWPQITFSGDDANSNPDIAPSVPSVHTVTFTGLWDSSLGTAAPTYTMVVTDTPGTSNNASVYTLTVPQSSGATSSVSLITFTSQFTFPTLPTPPGMPTNSDWTLVLPTPITNKPPMTVPCPFEDRMYLTEQDVWVHVPGSCPTGAVSTTIPWDCAPTATFFLAVETTASFNFGCIHWTGVGTDLHTFSQFPTGVYIELLDKEPDDDDEDNTSHCDGFYIFFICIPFPHFNVDLSWVQLHFPQPGPFVIIGPPPIRFPTIHGIEIGLPKLPGPWPPITIDPHGHPVMPQEEPTNCESQEAEVCATSTFISTTVIDSSTSTITSSATTECNTITACVITEVDQDTTSATGDYCTLPTPAAAERIQQISDNTTAPAEDQEAHQFQPPTYFDDDGYDYTPMPPPPGFDHAMIWPKNPGNSEEVARITDWLKTTASEAGREHYASYKEMKANGFGDDGSDWTMLIFVEDMRNCHIDAFKTMFQAEIACIYGIYQRTKQCLGPSGDSATWNSATRPHMETDLNKNASEQNQIQRRTLKMLEADEQWELSQVAVAPGEAWFESSGSQWPDDMKYPIDDSFGAGQTIFVTEDAFWYNHDELWSSSEDGDSRPPISVLPGLQWSDSNRFRSDETHPARKEEYRHGTGVTSKAIGWRLGLAKHAQAILLDSDYTHPSDFRNVIYERHVEKLVRTWNKVKQDYAEDPSRRGTYTLTNSMMFDGIALRFFSYCPTFKKRWHDLVDKLVNELDVVFVQTLHNNYHEYKDSYAGYPPLWCDPNEPDKIENLICVGGVDVVGRIAGFSPWTADLVMAPAYDVFAATSRLAIDGQQFGNSYATPLIAGLVAYWRGLPDIKNGWGEELKDPANVKKLLRYMQRPLDPNNLARGLDKSKITVWDAYNARGMDPPMVPFIWSGEYKGQNCLTNPDIHPGCPRGSLADLVPSGAGCNQPTSGTCIAATKAPTNTAGPGAFSNPLTFQTGPATVTCAPGAPECGALCTGFYCGSTATANSSTVVPPDHYDPEDPAHASTVTEGITATQPQTTSKTSLSIATIYSTMDVTSTMYVTVPKSSSTSISMTPVTSNGSPSGTTNSLLYTGTGCASYTSTRFCPERGVCLDGNLCLPTQPPCPKWEDVGVPLCPRNKPSCKSPQTTTSCLEKRHEAAAPTSTAGPTPLPANVTQQDTGLSIWQRRGVNSQEDDYLCLAGKGACSVTHYCNDADCVKPSGVQRVACVEAQIVLLTRATVKEAFVTITEDGKVACAFSIYCFVSEGEDCLEQQIKDGGGGVECAFIGRIASWTNGLSDMEFVSNTGGADYSYHLFFALREAGLNVCYARRDPTQEFAMCYRTEWAALDGACSPAIGGKFIAPRHGRQGYRSFGLLDASLNETVV